MPSQKGWCLWVSYDHALPPVWTITAPGLSWSVKDQYSNIETGSWQQEAYLGYTCDRSQLYKHTKLHPELQEYTIETSMYGFKLLYCKSGPCPADNEDSDGYNSHAMETEKARPLQQHHRNMKELKWENGERKYQTPKWIKVRSCCTSTGIFNSGKGYIANTVRLIIPRQRSSQTGYSIKV